MFSQETVKTLKKIGISDSFIFEYPVTVITNDSKSVTAFIDISDIEDEFNEKIGFFYKSEFLNLLDIIENANVTYEDDILTIKNDGVEVKYQTSVIEAIERKNYVPPSIKDKIKNTAIISAEFNLTKDLIDKILKLSGILRSQDLVIDFREDIKIILTNFIELDKYTNPSEIYIDGNKNEDGVVVIKVDDLRKIPKDDYIVKVIKARPDADKSLFLESQTLPVNILLASSESF